MFKVLNLKLKQRRTIMIFRCCTIVFYLLLMVSNLTDISAATSELESSVGEKEPFRLLFLCTGNSCRSQMAEGWARHFSCESVEVQSAGIKAHGLNPRAIYVMEESGVDISFQTSKVLTPDMLENVNLVVTVCGDADESCPCLRREVKKIHWPISDPAKATGTDEEILTKFREVRDELRGRIKSLLENMPLNDDKIGVKKRDLSCATDRDGFKRQDILKRNLEQRNRTKNHSLHDMCRYCLIATSTVVSAVLFQSLYSYLTSEAPK